MERSKKQPDSQSKSQISRCDSNRISDEKFYRTIINSSPDWELWYSASCELEYCSPSSQRITGYQAQDFITNPDLLLQIIHPEDRDRYSGRHLKHKENSCKTEFRIEDRQGKFKWMCEVSNKIFCPDGTLRGWRVTIRDFTQHKQVEEALKESENRFRIMADGLPLIVWMHDAQGRQEFVNRTFCKFFGVSREQMKSDRWQMLIHPEDVESYTKEFLECTKEQRPFNARTRVLDAKGRWRTIESWAKPRFSGQGNFRGFVGTSADITEGVEAERKLKEASTRLSTAVELARLGICEYDPSTKIITCDDRAKEILGVLGDESLTLSRLLELVHPEDRELIKSHIRRMLQSNYNQIYQTECRIIRPDRTQRWISARGDAVISGQGCNSKVRRYIKVIMDITDRKQAEQTRQEMLDKLEEQVRERTAQLNSYAEQLSELTAEIARVEQKERKKLATILHDNLQQILAGAKLNVGIMKSQTEDVSLKDIAQDTIKALEESIEVSRSLSTELSPPVLRNPDTGVISCLKWLCKWVQNTHGLSVRLKTDGEADTRIERVKLLVFECVRELLFNATKHSGVKNAQVRFIRDDDHYVQVIVSDNGKGFNPNELQRDKGFGLFGLQEKIALFGGSLKIQSQPGNGAQFIITLPLRCEYEAAKEEVLPSSNIHIETTGKKEKRKYKDRIRLLLVDDHTVMRQGLSTLLKTQKGIDIVGQACNGQEAIEKARQLNPDVILMDYGMPEMNGAEAAKTINLRQPDIEIIGLSMYDEAEVAEAMKDAGVNTVLSKSGPADVILSELRKLQHTAEPSSTESQKR